MFPDPDELILDRKSNRHYSFGLGVHRCIGSNVARMVFKTMLTAVLQRMPDYTCIAGAEHYDTVGLINGMKHLPATYTPNTRTGPTLTETINHWQHTSHQQTLAEPITRSQNA
jgi:hypothetical protein